MLITNFKKYIVILDATTKYRDMYFAEWAEKPAAHDMVKKFVSGIPNTHCGMGLGLVSRSRTRIDSSPPPPLFPLSSHNGYTNEAFAKRGLNNVC